MTDTLSHCKTCTCFKKRSAPRSRRVPMELELTSERRSFALDQGLMVSEVRQQFDAFCDHEFAAPKSDWDAAWRNWARRAAENKNRRGT